LQKQHSNIQRSKIKLIRAERNVACAKLGRSNAKLGDLVSQNENLMKRLKLAEEKVANTGSLVSALNEQLDSLKPLIDLFVNKKRGTRANNSGYQSFQYG